MAPEEQLERERQGARLAGPAALVAGVCVLLATFAPAFFGESGSARSYDGLLDLNDTPAVAIGPAVLQAIAFPLAAIALVYLYRAAKARRPETLRITYVLAIAGPLIVAIASLTRAGALVDLASKAADSGIPNDVAGVDGGIAELAGAWAAGEIRVTDLTADSSVFVASEIALFAGRLAYGFALVLVSLNAMRAGLLSRFIGILGIIAGVVTVLFRGAGPIEAFWLIAVGILILDRWPNGRGPAWETGEPDPWPTAMDRQRQLMEERGEVVEDDEQLEPEAEEEYEEEGPEPSEPAAKAHPASKKRKKKRRR